MAQQTANKCSAFVASLALLSLNPLGAEGNGLFIEGGFEYSNFASVAESSRGVSTWTFGGHVYTLRAPSNSVLKSHGNLFGADIQFGYKQFFGAKRRFGLRYYGLFSGQGGNYYQTAGGFSQPSANLFYGVGLDVLYDFYEKKNHSYGIFAGVMLGGSSWLMGQSRQDKSCVYTSDLGACKTMNEHFDQLAEQNNRADDGQKASFSPTFVQFIVNIGFRANFSKHQGFELGVRTPTIDDPYYTATAPSQTSRYQFHGIGYAYTTGSAKSTYTFRRNIAIYANYVYNF